MPPTETSRGMIFASGAMPVMPIAVAAGRGDDAGDGRAVRADRGVELAGGVVVGEVPAVAVADVAVAVEVGDRPAGFVGVRPQRVGQVGVRDVHPGVDDGDGHARAARVRPRRRHVGVGARGHVARVDEVPVAAVLQVPLLVRERVVADVRDACPKRG